MRKLAPVPGLCCSEFGRKSGLVAVFNLLLASLSVALPPSMTDGGSDTPRGISSSGAAKMVVHQQVVCSVLCCLVLWVRARGQSGQVIPLSHSLGDTVEDMVQAVLCRQCSLSNATAWSGTSLPLFDLRCSLQCACMALQARGLCVYSLHLHGAASSTLVDL